MAATHTGCRGHYYINLANILTIKSEYTSSMNSPIADNWRQILRPQFTTGYFRTLWARMSAVYQEQTVYPAQSDIFAAFNLCPLSSVRVVILGQDPYHGCGQAHGLAFSVPDDVAVPPSLRNIVKEITSDIGHPPVVSGNLTAWAQQGVLLLNSTLTVEKDKAGSHQSLGWEQFTDGVISTISHTQHNVVFLLWGAFAGQKRSLIDETKHLVLTAPHPSPLSAYRGFFGCRHFSKTNTYLVTHNRLPITW